MLRGDPLLAGHRWVGSGPSQARAVHHHPSRALAWRGRATLDARELECFEKLLATVHCCAADSEVVVDART